MSLEENCRSYPLRSLERDLNRSIGPVQQEGFGWNVRRESPQPMMLCFGQKHQRCVKDSRGRVQEIGTQMMAMQAQP